MKYREFWESKSKVKPPENAELAALYANNGALAKPIKIRTRRKQRDRFTRVEWVEFGEIPDFDETSVVLPDEADDGGWGDFAEFDEPETTQADEFDPEPSVYMVPQSEPKTCQQCRHYVFDDLDDSRGVCSLYGKELTGLPDNVGPDVCFEEHWPEEDLPF